jgi:hypothetical protein
VRARPPTQGKRSVTGSRSCAVSKGRRRKFGLASELSERGVVFNDPPTVQAYGIDTSFRDPSGNNIRLTQVLEFDPDRH